MKTIVILYGGKSSEHEVSLRSGGAVYTNLDRSRFRPLLIAVDHDGTWYYQENPGFENDNKTLTLVKNENLLVSVIPGRGLYCEGRKIQSDIIFPVLHGTYGEDGILQGFLETADLPYAGAGVLGSAIGMDKALSKQVWKQSGLPVVPFITVRTGAESEIEISLKEAAAEFGYPLFVKPANAGSSIGVEKANTMEELRQSVENGFRFDVKLLIEPAIEGREIECSVIGNMNPVSFLPGEVISDNYYDYNSKYIHPENVTRSIPADLTVHMKNEIKETAEKAFYTAGIEGFARVDFFIENSSGRILLNEINTLPGFTDISMFAELCTVSGLSYRDMLTKIINLAEERHNIRSSLIYKKDQSIS
jgi:D-alanine-D-alanine ligase